MLNRLKSLPLTILLTALIWMYAEAQFTASPTEHFNFNIKFIPPPSSSLAVRVIDPPDGQFTVALRGPKNEVDRVTQQADGAASFSEQDRNDLTCVIKDKLNPGLNWFASADVLNSLKYFKDRGITITTASPAQVKIDAEELATVRQRPIDFRSGAVTLAGPPQFQAGPAGESPGFADVTLPKRLLAAIGGPAHITVYAQPLRSLTTLPPDSDQVVPAHLAVDYPGPPDPRVTVTPDQVNIVLKIAKAQEHTLALRAVPVLIAGPAAFLNKYDIIIRPAEVDVTVAGPQARLAALRETQNNSNTPVDETVRAYLDVGPADATATAFTRRQLRYVLPDTLQFRDGSRQVEFKVIPKAAAPPDAEQ